MCLNRFEHSGVCLSAFFVGETMIHYQNPMSQTVIFLKSHENSWKFDGVGLKIDWKMWKKTSFETWNLFMHISRLLFQPNTKYFIKHVFLSLWKKSHKNLIWIFPNHDQMNIIWRDLPTNGKIQPKIRIFDGLQEVVSRLSSGVRGRVSTLNLSTHPENAFSGL